METTNNLSWTAIADKPWIHLNPSSGSGDKNIEVTVDNYDGYSEDVTGTVTVSCDACKITTEPTVIEVCRCACKCDDITFTQKITKLHESGATVGTVLATYSISKRCSANRISANIKNNKTGAQNSLKVSNNEISLQTAIPYNEEENDVTYDIVITFDGPEHECKTFQITQDALECNCTASIKSLVYESILTNGVPQSGIQANTKLLTYELKQYCPLSKLKVVLTYKDDDGTNRTRTLRLENGEGYLSTAISGNNTVNNRPITATVEWDSETCSTRIFQQTGCKCETALVGESFGVNISTFGVAGGTEIGSYEMNSQTTCPETALTAALKNKSTGRVYNLVCNNGKVYLANDDEIEENTTKVCVNFELVVNYNGFECDRADICQKGVDCNCDDIRGKVSFNNSFITIPKEGLRAGTVVGEYRLGNPKCEDDNDCFKIEETTGTIQLQLINNQIKLLNDIQNNEDPIQITYYFIVYYKVNNKWRNCDDTLHVTQKGLECSCNSITISTESGNLPSFPYEGTHNRWIQFASGDTAMYKYKGQPNQEFAGVCGKLVALDDSEYLNADNEENVENRVSNIGDKIRVIGTPLTPEETNKVIANQGETFLIPHIYYFYVNIKDISDIQEKIRRTLEPTVHFLKRTEQGTDVDIECTDKSLGLAISPDACSCSSIEFHQRTIYCDGYRNLTQLGYATASHNDMTIDAELLECGIEYDICEESIEKAVYISNTNKINLLGNGDFIILTVDAPVIQGITIVGADINDGVLYVYTGTSYYSTGIEVGKISDLIEGKKFIPEDACYIYDFVKSFNSMNKRLTVSGKVESNLTEDTRIAGIVRMHYYCNKGKVNEWYCGCKDFALQQANGCVCNCEYVMDNKDSSTTLEFSHDSTTAETILSTIGGLSDCIHYYLENTNEDGYVKLNGWCEVKITKDYGNIYLYGEITDGKHENRSASVTVHYNYLVGHDEETGAPIYSEDCGTDNITVTDEVCDCSSADDLKKNVTVTISAGNSNGSSWLGYQKLKDCVNLYIEGDDGTKYYAKPSSPYNVYTFKENNVELFDVWLVNGYFDKDTKVEVKLKSGVTLENEYNVTVKGEVDGQDCGISIDVLIKQEKCDCDKFKRKVSTYEDFTQRDGSSIVVANLSSGCGSGTLYAFDGETGYSSVEDMPDSLKAHITSMPNPCSTGDFEVGVNEPEEGESFSIYFGLCQCNDEGETILDDDGNCACMKGSTITDSFVKDCSDVNCNNYNFNLSLSENDLGTISKGGGSQNVVTFNLLPEGYESCYDLIISCNNAGVENYEKIVDGSKYALQMKLNNNASVGSIIRVDFACKYIGGYSEQICQQTQTYIRLKVEE